MIAGTLLGRAPRTLSSGRPTAWATSLLRTRLLPWKEIEEDGWHATSDLLIEQYTLFPRPRLDPARRGIPAPRLSAATDAYMLAWAEEALGFDDPPSWLPRPEHNGAWYSALPDQKPSTYRPQRWSTR